jgi:hypothetical protein
MEAQRRAQTPGGGPAARRQAGAGRSTALHVLGGEAPEVLTEQYAAARAVQRVWRGHAAREAIADRLWSDINQMQAQPKQAHAGRSSAPQPEPSTEPQPSWLKLDPQREPEPEPEPEPELQLQLQPQPQPQPQPSTEPHPSWLKLDPQRELEQLRTRPDAAASPPTPPAGAAPRVTGIIGIRRRTPCPYPESLPESVTPQSERAQTSIPLEKLESSRLRNSIVSSPEAQRLRQLRDEGGRLVSPLQLTSSLQRQLVTSDSGSSYTRTPYERRILQLRELHARDAAMEPHALRDRCRDLPTPMSHRDVQPGRNAG